MAATDTMKMCETTNCNSEAKLQCPTCIKMGISGSFFCGQVIATLSSKLIPIRPDSSLENKIATSFQDIGKFHRITFSLCCLYYARCFYAEHFV